MPPLHLPKPALHDKKQSGLLNGLKRQLADPMANEGRSATSKATRGVRDFMRAHGRRPSVVPGTSTFRRARQPNKRQKYKATRYTLGEATCEAAYRPSSAHLKLGPSPIACLSAEYLTNAERSSSFSMPPSLLTSNSLKMLLIALNE